jgi:hypothetical protein
MRLDINNVQYMPGRDAVNVLLVHELGPQFYLILSQDALQTRAAARSASTWSDEDVLAIAQTALTTSTDPGVIKFASHTITYPA